MTAIEQVHDLKLGGAEFQRLSRFINDYSGIKMASAKKTMVEGRLRRRVRSLGFDDFKTYCRYVFEEGGLDQEGVHIIDAVTTNKTEFFREPEHFRLLKEIALPRLIPLGRSRLLKLWSAACSTGAEPYTLAMLLAEYAREHAGFDYEIFATDLCTEVLKTAKDGIFTEDMVLPVPLELRRRHMLRSRDHQAGVVRMAPAIRRKVRFGRLNLMDERYPLDTGMDIVFCRNVLIYFEKSIQQAVLSRLCDHLAVGGFLFIGHSETVAGFHLPVQQVAPTVFIKV